MWILSLKLLKTLAVDVVETFMLSWNSKFQVYFLHLRFFRNNLYSDAHNCIMLFSAAVLKAKFQKTLLFALQILFYRTHEYIFIVF